jgi:NADH-quinone oxidoreductase subunit E
MPMPKSPRRAPARAVSLDKLFESFAPSPASVIPILQEIQLHNGYLSPESLSQAARYTRAPLSRIYGVATFYSQFRLNRPGRHVVRVCEGTACHVLGATEIRDELQEKLGVGEGETTSDGLFTLEIVRCLGCCSLAPSMMVDNETYGRLTRKRLGEVLASFEVKERG